MSRLTIRDKNGEAHMICKQMCGDYGHQCDGQIDVDMCQRYVAFDKLAEYEDLEEQGLLLKLPCKEAYTQSGDFVYLIYDYDVIECTHCGLSVNPVDGKGYIALAADEHIFPYRSPDPERDLDPTDWCTNITDVEVSEIGKTVFFTKEEAEAKLKESEV